MSSDPVSDFLAREQTALADLNIESSLENGFSVQNGTDDELNRGFVMNAADEINDISAQFNGISNDQGMIINNSTTQYRMEEEPEKIRKWRDQQKELIAEKDKAEEKKKEELRQQAKKELEDWHAQRKAMLEQRKKQNREREKKYLEEFSSKNAGESQIVWERIAKMVDSQSSKAAKSNVKDTSRLKSLLTHGIPGVVGDSADSVSSA